MKAKWLKIPALLALAIGLGSCMDSEDPNAALNAEISKIDAYLQSQGIRDKVLEDGSGIRFLPNNTSSQGAPPQRGQDVKFTYTRRLLSDPDVIESTGTISDDFEDIKPDGVRYVLSLMMQGSTVTAFIPSQYAYGEAGTTGVPANATLIYTLSLQEVVKTTGQITQLKTDTTAIQKYFRDNNIQDTVFHPSGLFYKVEAAGGGMRPTVYELISFKYKLKLLSNPSNVIQENTLTNYMVFNLIDGLKIGLPLMMEGAKVTFYIPSGLAYGTESQSSTIPANSNLIFEIEITDVP